LNTHTTDQTEAPRGIGSIFATSAHARILANHALVKCLVSAQTHVGLLITTCNWLRFPTIFGEYLACALYLVCGDMANGEFAGISAFWSRILRFWELNTSQIAHILEYFIKTKSFCGFIDKNPRILPYLGAVHPNVENWQLPRMVRLWRFLKYIYNLKQNMSATPQISSI